MNATTHFTDIITTEQLRAEKQRVAAEMEQSASVLQGLLTGTFLPRDRSLLRSPVETVRYASYAITAYKTVRSVRRWIKFFRGKR